MKVLKNGIEKVKTLIGKDELEKAADYVYNSLDKFKSYYSNFNERFKKDFKKCKKGTLGSYNRDFLWLFCLDILPYDQPKSWLKIINELRTDYMELKSGVVTKEIEDFIMLNEKKGEEKYNKYQKILNKEDFELLDLIKLDIERTYQEIDLLISNTQLNQDFQNNY